MVYFNFYLILQIYIKFFLGLCDLLEKHSTDTCLKEKPVRRKLEQGFLERSTEEDHDPFTRAQQEEVQQVQNQVYFCKFRKKFNIFFYYRAFHRFVPAKIWTGSSALGLSQF